MSNGEKEAKQRRQKAAYQYSGPLVLVVDENVYFAASAGCLDD